MPGSRLRPTLHVIREDQYEEFAEMFRRGTSLRKMSLHFKVNKETIRRWAMRIPGCESRRKPMPVAGTWHRICCWVCGGATSGKCGCTGWRAA